jgi:Holliday junction resolvase RusA-like endonuclease
MKISFTVYGNPVGKQAAKAFYNKKKGQMYKFSPKKTTDWEQLIRSVAQDHVPTSLLDGPLKAAAIFYLLKPPSKAKKCLFPDTKPDHDNLEKAVYDALEKVIYINDSRIVTKHFKKRWGNPPRVEITIEPETVI